MSLKYLSFFNLEDDPFRLTPDTAYFYSSSAHTVALKSLEYCVMRKQGFCVLTGDPGTGKTTVLRIFMERCQDKAELALIMTPRLSPDEFFQAILDDFKIPLSSSKNEMLKSFRDFLLTHASQGRRVAIIVDEAQELPDTTLEELRLLSNLETGKEKLLQIILVGQPELSNKLAKNSLRQLNQRITLRVQLKPFSAAETSDYINTRLIKAGNSSLLFHPKAKALIYELSHGIPRTINLLASRALMSAYLNGSRQVAKQHVEQGARDVMEATIPVRRGAAARRAAPRALWGTLVLALVLAGAAAWYWAPLGREPQPPQAKAGPPPPAPPPAPSATPAPPQGASQAQPATADPVESLAQAVQQELYAVDPHRTVFNCFNLVAAAWNLPPVPQFAAPSDTPVKYLAALAQQRDLQLLNFDGNADGVLELGYPLILQIESAGKDRALFVALTGVQEGEFLIPSGLAGKTRLSRKELERVWQGKAIIAWKNYDKIPAWLPERDRTPAAAALQRLLEQAGIAVGKRGEFDRRTKAALSSFQRLKGLEVTGEPDARTLLFLYQGAPGYFHPALKQP